MDVYAMCVDAVTGAALRQKYVANEIHMQQTVTDFDAATASVSWAGLPRVPNGNLGVAVVGTLTKGELIELYDQRMVGARGDSRRVYDDILVAAGGFCPSCGGLGQVRTLDHYLPKANFPAYSVLPSNLVPCCRDCNTGKNHTMGVGLHDQPLHPYLDEDKFFDERWMTAVASAGNPILLTYYCAPPAGWSLLDQSRVLRHFMTYDLGKRFSLQAGAELGGLVASRKKSLRTLSTSAFRDYLLDHSNNAGLDLNGWSRTMYAALAQTPWFVEANFNDVNWLQAI